MLSAKFEFHSLSRPKVCFIITLKDCSLLDCSKPGEHLICFIVTPENESMKCTPDGGSSRIATTIKAYCSLHVWETSSCGIDSLMINEPLRETRPETAHQEHYREPWHRCNILMTVALRSASWYLITSINPNWAAGTANHYQWRS